MRTLLMAALLAAGPALAEKVASNGSNELRLLDAACDHADILPHLKPEFHHRFKRAQATLQGRVIRACWIHTAEDDGEDTFYVIFEDGIGASYPAQLFKEAGA